MANFNKVTNGYVVQTFDNKGEFVEQEFIADDEVTFENEYGETLNLKELPKQGDEYFPFDMLQKSMDIDCHLLGDQLGSLCEVEVLLAKMGSPYHEHVTGICNLIGAIIHEKQLPIA